VVLKLRRFSAGLFGKGDPRLPLNRPKLYEVLSEIGFTRVFAAFNDFEKRSCRIASRMTPGLS
jgi:dolichol-phosphate mannosyltransferase